jgi:hypothetical protein
MLFLKQNPPSIFESDRVDQAQSTTIVLCFLVSILEIFLMSVECFS